MRLLDFAAMLARFLRRLAWFLYAGFVAVVFVATGYHRLQLLRAQRRHSGARGRGADAGGGADAAAGAGAGDGSRIGGALRRRGAGGPCAAAVSGAGQPGEARRQGRGGRVARSASGRGARSPGRRLAGGAGDAGGGGSDDRADGGHLQPRQPAGDGGRPIAAGRRPGGQRRDGRSVSLERRPVGGLCHAGPGVPRLRAGAALLRAPRVPPRQRQVRVLRGDRAPGSCCASSRSPATP